MNKLKYKSYSKILGLLEIYIIISSNLKNKHNIHQMTIISMMKNYQEKIIINLQIRNLQIHYHMEHRIKLKKYQIYQKNNNKFPKI